MDRRSRQRRQRKVHDDNHPRRAADHADHRNHVDQAVRRQVVTEHPYPGADGKPRPQAHDAAHRLGAGAFARGALLPQRHDRPRRQGQRHQAHVSQHLAQVPRPPPALRKEVRPARAHQHREKRQHPRDGEKAVLAGGLQADPPARHLPHHLDGRQQLRRGDDGRQHERATGQQDRPPQRTTANQQIHEPHNANVDQRRPVPRRDRHKCDRHHPAGRSNVSPPQALDAPQAPRQPGGRVDQRKVNAVADHETAEHEGRRAEQRRAAQHAQPPQVRVCPAAGQRERQEYRKAVREFWREHRE